ncbi:30S ribosomal protein S1 [Aquicella siphonis]|uniref:30S ribosomal protein S1 n=1 Tax=Aquicella siphonis TaxID=254247 RepID=A0A5E4PJB9_9COXI|nr:Tex family protein [Aquicella siphonis]VVC76441.1 30S ribosomal protein S1 [Aquicella siphonis]
MNINEKIASELNVAIQQIDAAIQLLDSGATVPFISRYRKEATGGLTDTQLRELEIRLHYLREMDERRQTILKSIADQHKLTPELEQTILQAESKSALEDLYLPYKPKRRTKAQIAKEAGLEPLAWQLLNNPALSPQEISLSFLSPEHQILTAENALEGARHILMEHFAEHAGLLGEFRSILWDHGILKCGVIKGKETEGSKFADYFSYQEPIRKIPSHRALAVFRGQREQILNVTLFLEEDRIETCLLKIMQTFGIQNNNRPADNWLIETVKWAWNIKIFLKLELEAIMQLREQADEEGIKVFASNLNHLLMAAPAGSRVTLGLDPGLRTGVKAVVIDGTGKLLAHVTIFPHAPRNEWDASLSALARLCQHHAVELISIGNGTASRETDKLVSELKKRHPELKLTSIVVSEAGASVYSASELAAQEFPDLDVSYRGAVSIARRLQDPLAELVKIDPKSIGVGQYQHDVNQAKLSRTLHAVMEDCVNAVGVNVNTASAPLLACVAGLNESVAKNVIRYRDENGAFKNRQALKKVPRLGDKAFEQAAGFLRIVNGDNPLDASAVHPEAYAIVERILKDQKKPIQELMGNTALLTRLNAAQYTDAQFGLPTVKDILHELEKPGRDPRPEFKTAVFKEGIETLADLRAGMILEGVVTNVSNFGAFVDIGVHQDGLVHISMLADRFVKDPHSVVKVGDIVKVKVLEIDIQRKRIQLSMRLSETPAPASARQTGARAPGKLSHGKAIAKSQETTLGNMLLQALQKKK